MVQLVTGPYVCDRSCRFFEFADQNSTAAALAITWRRFPATDGWLVVSDEGFNSSDVACLSHGRR